MFKSARARSCCDLSAAFWKPFDAKDCSLFVTPFCFGPMRQLGLPCKADYLSSLLATLTTSTDSCFCLWLHVRSVDRQGCCLVRCSLWVKVDPPGIYGAGWLMHLAMAPHCLRNVFLEAMLRAEEHVSERTPADSHWMTACARCGSQATWKPGATKVLPCCLWQSTSPSSQGIAHVKTASSRTALLTAPKYPERPPLEHQLEAACTEQVSLQLPRLRCYFPAAFKAGPKDLHQSSSGCIRLGMHLPNHKILEVPEHHWQVIAFAATLPVRNFVEVADLGI